VPFSATRDLWLVLKARDEASRAMGAFSRDIRMVGDSVKLANLQAARSALVNHQAIQRMTGASQQDILVTQRRIQQLDQQIGQMRVAKAAMEEQRVSSQRLASALQGTAGVATALGTGLVAAGAFGLMGLKKLVDASVDYQKQSALTVTQVDKFAISLQDIEKIGLRVANAVGVPFQEIQPALFDIFSSMEVGASDAEKLLTVFSKAAVAGQTDIQSASKATIGILNAFQLPLTSINHLMDVQFQLVKEGIGSYSDWTAKIGQVTPSAVRFGQSVDIMAAALAASTRTGQLASQSAAAVARAMDAMSNPTAIEAMKQFGVNAVDAQGNFRSMIDILFDFRKQLDKIPGEAAKTKAIVDIFKGAGGTIQARRFLQNMLMTPGNLELFQNIFKTMSTESGSFEQAYETMAGTVATQSQLVANKWETLKIAAGTALTPSFMKVLDIVGKVLDKFNQLSPATQKTIMTIIGLSVVGSIVIGMLLLFLGLLAGLIAAITVAGSAILVVTGVMAGLIAGIVALTVALILAWKRSQEFRDLIMSVADVIEHLWKDIIVPFAQDLAAGFEKNILPALIKFRDIIKNDVMPLVTHFVKVFGSEFLARAKEAANLIKDKLVFAFDQIGQVLNKIVIPAFQWLTKFYKEHKETVDQLIKIFMQLAKWLFIIGAIITGVLLVVFGGPIVGIIVTFALLIAGIGIAIIWVVERVKDIIDWFKHFGEHMSWLGDRISDAWKFIKDQFNRGIDAIRAVWEEFWNSRIGRFLASILNVISSLIELAVTIWVAVFNFFLDTVTTAWNTTWNALSSVVQAVWGFIGPYLQSAWETISGLAVKIWTPVKNFFVGLWNDISKFVTDKARELRDNLSGAWEDIKTRVVNAWNDVRKFFDDTGTWLRDAGRNLIQGFIDGMTDKFNALADKIREFAQFIKDHFPHSPAKRGPLAGKGGMFYAGQNIVTQLNDGINSRLSMVGYGTSLLANAAGNNAIASQANSGGGNTINQTVNVNTQELNPRRQAAELGWLLAGSM